MLQSALAAEHVILSSAGAHARQDWLEIIARKQADIARADHTVWVVNSLATRPEVVQPFCRDLHARYVIFLSRRGRESKSASGPSTNDRAQAFSNDGQAWSRLPFWPQDHNGLSEVTGRINRMPGPTLLLRRASVSRQSGQWQHEDFDVFDGTGDVGRIYLVDSNAGTETWFWGVDFALTNRKSYGHAASLDEAKAAFKAEYEAWRGRAELP
jgi:hypothetical protein